MPSVWWDLSKFSNFEFLEKKKQKKHELYWLWSCLIIEVEIEIVFVSDQLTESSIFLKRLDLICLIYYKLLSKFATLGLINLLTEIQNQE